ncbi:MAG TPA: hypothetical protein PKH58_01390 [Paludibacteraceae bacterium]|nr:hypothetical protein [Paludibacteraceae bacterium]
MFALYEYLDSVKAALSIDKIYRISGILQLEEFLNGLGDAQDTVVFARDSGDGYLNINDRRLDTAYHMFYVFQRAEINDNDSRLDAKRNSMAKGITIVEKIKAESKDFGDPAYGFNAARIDYSEIGPIARNYYGYSFAFIMENHF